MAMQSSTNATRAISCLVIHRDQAVGVDFAHGENPSAQADGRQFQRGRRVHQRTQLGVAVVPELLAQFAEVVVAEVRGCCGQVALASWRVGLAERNAHGDLQGLGDRVKRCPTQNGGGYFSQSTPTLHGSSIAEKGTSPCGCTGTSMSCSSHSKSSGSNRSDSDGR